MYSPTPDPTPAAPCPDLALALASNPLLHLAPGPVPGSVNAFLEHKDLGSSVLCSCRIESKRKQAEIISTVSQTLAKISEKRGYSHCWVPPKLNPQTFRNCDSDFPGKKTKHWRESPCQVHTESLVVSTLRKQVSIPRLLEPGRVYTRGH